MYSAINITSCVKQNAEAINPISVSCGYFSSCYVNSQGELFAKGINTDGQLGNLEFETQEYNKIDTPTKVVKAVISLFSLCYIDENGDVYVMGVCGKNNKTPITINKPIQVKDIKNAIDIKSGATHFLILDEVNDVWTLGENECGQVNPEKNYDSWIPFKTEFSQPIIKICCGQYTSCVVTEDCVTMWGEDNYGFTESSCFNGYFQIDMKNVTNVSFGRNHMIIKTNDEIFGYGSNYFSQMGDNNDTAYFSGETLDLGEFDVDSIEDISCTFSSTIFKINNTLYSLGDVSPFDEDYSTKELKKIKESNMFDCSGFQLVFNDKGRIETYGFNTMNSYTKYDDTKKKIALIDTGFDESNPYLINTLSKPESKGGFLDFDRWNVSKGTIDMVDDVFSDTHGTSMMSILAGYQLEENMNVYEHNPEIEILPLKILKNCDGRFVDLMTAIKISEFFDAKIVNCSFSIHNLCYENNYSYIVKESPTFFVCSLSDEKTDEQILVNSDNIVYIYYGKINNFKGSADVNMISVMLEKVNCFLFNEEIAHIESNSCATAYASNMLLNYMIENKCDMNADKAQSILR